MPLPTLYITKQIVLLCFWGDWRNSNPRPSEPQSDVLPTELQPHGGEGGIRTHARHYPSTPLAGEPLLATWVPRQIVMKKMVARKTSLLSLEVKEATMKILLSLYTLKYIEKGRHSLQPRSRRYRSN